MATMHRAFLILFLATFLSLAGCGGSGEKGVKPLPEAQWTVMVYMAGDSDISQAALHNINDMEEVGSTSQVNVVVQAEFSTEFSPALPGNTLRGRISRDHDPTHITSTLYDIGNHDMTDPATLRDFIEWAYLSHPARHYALVLWSHGLGWKASGKGMIKDVTSAGDSSIMSLPDMALAMHDSGVKFDLIDFDACLMGMYEVAYEMRGLSDFMTFSEALFPVYGNPYTIILNELTANPDMGSEELAEGFVSACSEYYRGLGYSFTKSAIRSSAVEEVHAGVNGLAQALLDSMAEEADTIKAAVNNTEEYYYFVYRDLGDFLDQLRSLTKNQTLLDSIAAVDSSLKDLVLEAQRFSPDINNPVTRSHGIAIYLPAPGLDVSRDLPRYSSLSCNQNGGVTWYDFVSRMVVE